MLSYGSLFFSFSLMCSLDSKMLFNISCAFRIHSLPCLTHFSSPFNSLTVYCNSYRLSFLLSFRFTHISPSLMLPYSLSNGFLGCDSSLVDIPTYFIISYKSKVILLFLFVRDPNHNNIKLVLCIISVSVGLV